MCVGARAGQQQQCVLPMLPVCVIQRRSPCLRQSDTPVCCAQRHLQDVLTRSGIWEEVDEMDRVRVINRPTQMRTHTRASAHEADRWPRWLPWQNTAARVGLSMESLLEHEFKPKTPSK